MIRILIPISAVAAGLAVLPAPARADFSACAAAYASKDPHQQIDLYTTCLKHGGLVSTDVAGAFTNRGVAYAHIGDLDKALADFSAAIQYDPGWPLPYSNRAGLEAGRGQCAAALADMDAALKYAPHRKEFLEERARIQAGCPIAAKPPN
jgi:tetratricopeptide (TPR) repeat protein